MIVRSKVAVPPLLSIAESLTGKEPAIAGVPVIMPVTDPSASPRWERPRCNRPRLRSDSRENYLHRRTGPPSSPEALQPEGWISRSDFFGRHQDAEGGSSSLSSEQNDHRPACVGIPRRRPAFSSVRPGGKERCAT